MVIFLELKTLVVHYEGFLGFVLRVACARTLWGLYASPLVA